MTANTLPQESYDRINVPLPIHECPVGSSLDDSTTAQLTMPSRGNVVLFTNRVRSARKREQELQWWIGKVIAIYADHFTAELKDLFGKINYVDFSRSEIGPFEKELLFEGSQFTYCVSYIDKSDGREYKTRLAFSSRRKWLKEYDEKAKKLAEEIFPERLLNL